MQVRTESLEFRTDGATHILDITSAIQDFLKASGMSEGNVLVFGVGSTTGITTLEYEPGLVQHDVAAMFEQLAPYRKAYRHNLTWGDDNGAAHLRSALTGTSLTIPFINGELVLGRWQQVVFIDFDTRPRSRRVVVQVMGH